MASLSELAGILHEEHFRIIMWVTELNNSVTVEHARGSRHPDDESRELCRLISAIDDFFHHHAFEEDTLFPLLAAHGDTATASYFSQEHAVIEPILRRLRFIASDRLGYRGDRWHWPRFRRAVNTVYAEILGHLAREEELIVQRLRSLLDPESDRRLAHQHFAIPLLFGAGTR